MTATVDTPANLRAAIRAWWVPEFRAAWLIAWRDIRCAALCCVAYPSPTNLRAALAQWGGLLPLVTPLPIVHGVYVPLYIRRVYWWPALRAWWRTRPTLAGVVREWSEQLAALEVERESASPDAPLPGWRRPASSALAELN